MAIAVKLFVMEAIRKADLVEVGILSSMLINPVEEATTSSLSTTIP
jgi:hypothetical protein